MTCVSGSGRFLGERLAAFLGPFFAADMAGGNSNQRHRLANRGI